MTSLESRFFENKKETAVQKVFEFVCSGVKPNPGNRKNYNLHLLNMMHQRRTCKKMSTCLKCV